MAGRSIGALTGEKHRLIALKHLVATVRQERSSLHHVKAQYWKRTERPPELFKRMAWLSTVVSVLGYGR
eukprot:1501100-Amphidinium_carterae.1